MPKEVKAHHLSAVIFVAYLLCPCCDVAVHSLFKQWTGNPCESARKAIAFTSCAVSTQSFLKTYGVFVPCCYFVCYRHCRRRWACVLGYNGLGKLSIICLSAYCLLLIYIVAQWGTFEFAVYIHDGGSLASFEVRTWCASDECRLKISSWLTRAHDAACCWAAYIHMWHTCEVWYKSHTPGLGGHSLC